MGFKNTETGEVIGFDIDVAKEACKRLGVEFVAQPINWDNKQMELDGGNIDCVWNGMSYTEERAQIDACFQAVYEKRAIPADAQELRI